LSGRFAHRSRDDRAEQFACAEPVPVRRGSLEGGKAVMRADPGADTF
jgi:hypothetical protein